MYHAYAQNNIDNNDEENDEIINTSYFSIEPLDNWTYEINSDKTTAQTIGSGASNAIILYPKDIDIGTAVEAGNAVLANFEQDNTYNVKNAPLSEYVKFKTENAAEVISQEDTTVDGEPAVKVLSDVKGDQGVTKYLFIYTVHDKKYYTIGLIGHTNNFNKYLPEFEQMLNTFNFLGLEKDSMDAEEIYENINLGIKFIIPEKFEVSESDLNKVVLSPKSMVESVYYEISIESLENNNGETLEKWLKKYLKDNYSDKDNFRIDVVYRRTELSKFSNDLYNGLSFNLLDRENHNYNEHNFVSVNDKIFHFSYSAPTDKGYFEYLDEYRNFKKSIEFLK